MTSYNIDLTIFGLDVRATVCEIVSRMGWTSDLSADTKTLIVNLPLDDVEIFGFIFSEYI